MKTLTLFILVLISESLLFGDVIHVPADTSTIQGGIYLANDGDTVLVAENTYYENINFKGKAITVASEFIMDGDTSHISKTIIDGSMPSHPDSGSVVLMGGCADTNSVISGFTITGGTGTKFYIRGRYDRYGGGIFAQESSALIKNNIIFDNNLSYNGNASGGGIAADTDPTPGMLVVIRNNLIQNNTVTSPMAAGGGIHVGSGKLNYIIEHNTIIKNTVTNTDYWKAMGGGIIHNYPLPTLGKMIIRNNIISYNELHCVHSFGAGVYIVSFELDENVIDHDPNPFIYNNIISNNYSEWKGGGICIWSGTVQNTPPSEGIDVCPQPILINNTIVNNMAIKGSGIYSWNSKFIIMNTILWNNLSPEGGNEIDMGITGNSNWDKYLNDGNEIYMYHSDIQGGWEGGNNLDTYPAFTDTSQGDYRLTEYSVCVGRGKDSVMVGGTAYYYPSTDYYGNLRPNPIDEFVDIGAVESEFHITKLEEIGETYIKRYTLSQNYPNPFNPSTTIEFTLPKSEFVELKVYNILGKEVSTLVSKKLNLGNHIYQFDGKNLASGIYYYQLMAGDFREVKKMILLR